MKKKIGIIYSTNNDDVFIKKYNEELLSNCGIGESNIEIYPIVNYGEYSLPEAYNLGIKYFSKNFNIGEYILVFIHHDIEFDTKEWGKKLLKHFNKPNNPYQIIGVAGATELFQHACWWLTADSKSMNTKSMMGIVNHDNGIRKWESRYSEPHVGVKPVLLIDGLFMAVDTEEIENKFDETYKGFHFYDVSFCIPNYLDGCNIGVITDVRITHKSIGQTNDQWELSRQKFAEQYKEELPLKVEEP